MTKDNMGELKPCPFCGSETGARVLPPTCRPETPYNPADRLFPIVRCYNCFTEVCGANEDYSGKTAIARWNTRALESIPQAGMRELVEGLRGPLYRLILSATSVDKELRNEVDDAFKRIDAALSPIDEGVGQ